MRVRQRAVRHSSPPTQRIIFKNHGESCVFEAGIDTNQCSTPFSAILTPQKASSYHSLSLNIWAAIWLLTTAGRSWHEQATNATRSCRLNWICTSCANSAVTAAITEIDGQISTRPYVRNKAQVIRGDFPLARHCRGPYQFLGKLEE